MNRPDKWVTGIAPDQPLSDAARQAVGDRLSMVWSYLADCSKKGERTEEIHQLRVWSRRAAAALELFQPVLPKRRTRKIKKALTKLRRAAGEARDLDVLSQRLLEGTAPHTSGELARLRKEARLPIRALHRRMKRRKLGQKFTQLIGRVHYRGSGREPTFGEAARAGLEPLVEQFCERAAHSTADAAALHALRIAAKRLRYAMELFADAFAPPLRNTLYPLIEQLQGMLGEINDHAVAIRRLERWRKETGDPPRRAELTQLLSAERAALARARKKFAAWWSAPRRRKLEGGLVASVNRSTTRAAKTRER